ncbi:MAG: carbohydrate porin [Candidatus Omnitrophica bacterium]|nr:carbohydrate porin [Candidatus Omnitrophota bacterium]
MKRWALTIALLSGLSLNVQALASTAALLEETDIGFGATGVVQGTDQANGDDLLQPEESASEASYSIDVEIEKLFGESGTGFLHLEAGGGAGIDSAVKAFSPLNYDADDDENVRVTELFYEHSFSKLPLFVTAGKLDPTVYLDVNNYANDECSQFLGGIFRNSQTIEFPDNAAGLRASYDPTEFLDLEFLALDADADFSDILGDLFLAAQVTLVPHLWERPGNYRFFAWTNNASHTKWLDTTRSSEDGFGAGLSWDQALTDQAGAFLRYAWQDSSVSLEGADFSLEHSWSLGVQLTGEGWKRDADVLGLAVGQNLPSHDYKKSQGAKGRAETHLELYYNWAAHENLTLTPDLQVVWEPFGGDAANGTDTLWVGGLRAQMDF